MIPRPYQARLVDKAEKALKKHGNTLALGATGAGKTIMLSMLAQKIKKKKGGKTLVLQHRQELVQQNLSKFRQVNPGETVGLFTADVKTWRGDTTFAMQQTLCRPQNLSSVPDDITHTIIDEAHHIAAPTYQQIIERLQEKNPDMLLTGFTATPERGDRKSLRCTFDNVCDRITIRELVGLGFLVPPRAFVIDVGAQAELNNVESNQFGEQVEVEKILNKVAINEEVVRHWREKAGDRSTVVFCSTVKHAQDVAQAYRDAGVSAEAVYGDMPDGQRKSILRRFDEGEIQVVTNCMILTEGWDSQPISCVVLLRQCSEKGTMIQMAGRGLRTVNPEIYPGVVKTDCIVLDFGVSILTHGNLDTDDGLHKEAVKVEGETEQSVKLCPTEPSLDSNYKIPDSNGALGCGAELPVQSRVCPMCGFRFERLGADEEDDVTSVSLSEIDILNASPFRWVDLFGNEMILMAGGFGAWAGVFSKDGEVFIALGKVREEKAVHMLGVTSKNLAMAAADDFLRGHETQSAAKKSQDWLNHPATGKQLNLLGRWGYDTSTDVMGNSQFTKYTAAIHSSFRFDQRLIEQALGV